MPIISRIGSRSWKTRLLYGAIHLVLILGAITMIYPLTLMLSGSTQSKADETLITPWPKFWTSDEVLLQKYVESKHNANLGLARFAYGVPLTDWRRLPAPPSLTNASDVAIFNHFLQWRTTPEARALADIGHARSWGIYPKNAREYRAAAIRRYGRDGLAKYRTDTGALITGWASVMPPNEWVGRYRNRSLTPAWKSFLQEFLDSRPAEDFYFLNPEGIYTQDFLPGLYGTDIASYNAAHGTTYAAYADIRLPTEAPADPSSLADWSKFLRSRVRLNFLHLSPEAASAFRAFCSARNNHSITLFNNAHKQSLASFDDIPFPTTIDTAPWLRPEWEAFLQSPDCLDSWIRLAGPYEAFLASLPAELASSTPLPSLGTLAFAADAHDCTASKSALRREFSTRNYRHVLEYVGLHGNGFRNTAIYCFLSICACLLVNPLAAYALSRFRLRATYPILLFCMTTMAFPAEVSMIPSFILTKRFPFWPLAATILTFLILFTLLARFAPRIRDRNRFLISLGSAATVGAITLRILAPGQAYLSLLNTWAALVLPGMANGYSIFLLKGFFDSLPKELYEAADIDGANEWTKFWTFTMGLSKPILAVLALGAFTGAYGAFMQALILTPNEEMWTLMVWIYQLQASSHGSVIYASLVLAAIPTFLIFAFCQNIILRGIVVPTEK